MERMNVGKERVITGRIGINKQYLYRIYIYILIYIHIYKVLPSDLFGGLK